MPLDAGPIPLPANDARARSDHFFEDCRELRVGVRGDLEAFWALPYEGLPFRRARRTFQWRRSGGSTADELFEVTNQEEDPRAIVQRSWFAPKAIHRADVAPAGSSIAIAVGSDGARRIRWHVVRTGYGPSDGRSSGWARPLRPVWLDEGCVVYAGSGPDDSEPGIWRYDPHDGSDECVLRLADRERVKQLRGSRDGGRVLAVLRNGSGSERIVGCGTRDLTDWQPLTPRLECSWDLIAVGDRELLASTDLPGPTKGVVAVPPDGSRRPEDLSEVVAPRSAALDRAWLVDDRLVLAYIGQAGHEVAARDVVGADPPIRLDLPTGLQVTDLRAVSPSVVELEVMGYTAPAHVYRADLRTGRLEYLRGALPERAPLTTSVESVRSADGASVSVHVCRGDAPEVRQPVVVTAYGGFGKSQLPTFRWFWYHWLRSGGAVAFVGVRGGSDRGRSWHEAAVAAGKEKSVQDLGAVVAALAGRFRGVYLYGASHGGLLAAQTYLNVGERCRGLVVESAVLDLAHHEELAMNGIDWTSEYGSNSHGPTGEAMERLSPVANAGSAPAADVLIVVGTDDSVVNPEHSYRFASALTQSPSSGRVLLRVKPAGVHRSGDAVRLADQRADVLAFLYSTSQLHPAHGC